MRKSLWEAQEVEGKQKAGREEKKRDRKGGRREKRCREDKREVGASTQMRRKKGMWKSLAPTQQSWNTLCQVMAAASWEGRRPSHPICSESSLPLKGGAVFCSQELIVLLPRTQGGSSRRHRARPFRAASGFHSRPCSALCWPALPTGLGNSGGWIKVGENGWATVWHTPFPGIEGSLWNRLVTMVTLCAPTLF